MPLRLQLRQYRWMSLCPASTESSPKIKIKRLILQSPQLEAAEFCCAELVLGSPKANTSNAIEKASHMTKKLWASILIPLSHS